MFSLLYQGYNLATNISAKVVGTVVGLLLIAILLPIGLDELTAYTSTNSNIQTLMQTVVPIIAVVGIVMAIVPKGNNKAE